MSEAPLAVIGGVSDTMSLGIALLVGIAFGWFLERGGMGDAHKLTGQFHLTDFAVFKVMFSAILTAMLGLFVLVRTGWVDDRLIYVPETFLLPQLIGGVVFGFGFVMAGLCPGTSCVAAASGRLDGLGAAAGMLGGVFVFAETYPFLATLHGAGARGVLTLPALTHLPAGVVMFLITIAAIGGFTAAGHIERTRKSS